MKQKPIANSWDEVTIELWDELQDILKNEELDAVDKNVALVALLYDIPDEEAYNLPLDEFSAALDTIGWLGKEPVVPEPSPSYMINDKTYEVSLTPNKMTTAQYIDFHGLQKENNFSAILSVIMVPKGHKYNDGYDMEEVRKDIYTKMRITHALSLSRFFFRLYITLTSTSLLSLNRTLKKELRKEKNPEKKERIQEQIRKTEELASMFGSLV